MKVCSSQTHLLPPWESTQQTVSGANMTRQLQLLVIQFPKSSFKFITKVRYDLDTENNSHINVLFPPAPPPTKLKSP